MLKIIYGLVVIALVAGAVQWYLTSTASAPPAVPADEEVACTMDAKMCPDGSAVGRSGPTCSFAACPGVEVPADQLVDVTEKADLITVATPEPGNYIASPLTVSGMARGYWFFEASFPVSLVNWDGLIIAEGVATAQSDWMTEDFVPFTVELTFTSPYQDGDPDFMQRGALILQRDNPSGLPENDNAIEIPIMFVAE